MQGERVDGSAKLVQFEVSFSDTLPNHPMSENPDSAPDPSIDDRPVSKTPAVLEVAGVVINYGIPIPDMNGGRKKGSKWDPVLEAMHPGASIFFPDDESMKREVNSFQRAAKKKEVMLTTRKIECEPELGVSGTRIWRRAE